VKATGTLTFDAFGNLRTEIRADQAASDLLRVSTSPGAVISSSGRTAVDLQQRTLTYVMEGQPAAGTGPLAMSRPR
jgi:hypothetical protein